MSRERPKEFYICSPLPFGNGAKIKAYKKHIDKEMIVMTRDVLKKIVDDVKKGKIKKISDKEFDEIEKKYAKKWSDKSEPV